MSAKTIDEILGDFNASSGGEKSPLKGGGPVTFWLPAKERAEYCDLQRSSGRQFSKVVRDGVIELIKAAKARAG